MRLSYNNIAPLLITMYDMYTGRESIGEISFDQIANVFKTSLDLNEDNLYSIIPTVLARTVYAVRPYRRRLAGTEWSEQMYGDYIRKLTPIIKDSEKINDEWNISVEEAKGTSADWKAGTAPEKYDVLMTVTSGGQSFSRKYTIFKNQLNAAFESEQGVADYFSMLMTEFSNQYEIDRENVARAQLANVILTIADAGSSSPTSENACKATQCWHVLSEYNNATGLSLTAQTVMNPQDFREFMIWFSAELATKKGLLGVHGTTYHGDVTGKEVNRHTADTEMRMYIVKRYAEYFSKNGAAIYHPEKAPIADYEEVDFWQSIDEPTTVIGTYKGLAKDGSTFIGTTRTVENVIGLICDVDMFGIVPVNEWSAPEPFNARFGFENVWNHYTFKTPVDFTENAILICLD